MTEDAGYHEMRAAAERALASSLPEGEARERHLELADRHADKAWLIRSGYAHGVVDQPASQSMSRRSTDYSLTQAIARSRELLARSHRVLAESRRNIPTSG